MWCKYDVNTSVSSSLGREPRQLLADLALGLDLLELRDLEALAARLLLLELLDRLELRCASAPPRPNDEQTD
jgi:hypothetical protein